MQFPVEMALAVFDPLETSYLAAISLRQYFSEVRSGYFPEGQSIREHSDSILKGHTIWDPFEYRLLQVFLQKYGRLDISAQLSKMVSDSVARLVDIEHSTLFTLDRDNCRLIALDAIAEMRNSDQVCFSTLTLNISSALARLILSVWYEILRMLKVMTGLPRLQKYQCSVEDAIQMEEEFSFKVASALLQRPTAHQPSSISGDKFLTVSVPDFASTV